MVPPHHPGHPQGIFHFDPERQRASLELPSLRPGIEGRWSIERPIDFIEKAKGIVEFGSFFGVGQWLRKLLDDENLQDVYTCCALFFCVTGTRIVILWSNRMLAGFCWSRSADLPGRPCFLQTFWGFVFGSLRFGYRHLQRKFFGNLIWIGIKRSYTSGCLFTNIHLSGGVRTDISQDYPYSYTPEN